MELDKKPVLIEVKDLKTHFFMNQGLIRAVDGVNLTIYRGETLGVVGESGCGKSITARSILRLIQPPGKVVSGQILLHQGGENGAQNETIVDLLSLDANSQQIRRIRGGEIAMVFQEPMTSLSPVHTVGDQITEAIRLHQNVTPAEAKEIAIDMLGRVRMVQPDRVFDQYPFSLSGGMRQRVCIAMALVCRPSLLIADEPTTALDVTTEAQILNVMRKLQSELGMAIMFITHNLGVIAQMATRVAVMYLGQVVEVADVKTLFQNPQHPYTQALMRSIPRLGKKTGQPLESVRGSVPDPFTQLSGCRFHTRCSHVIPGVCNVTPPPMVVTAEGHEVRCVLYEKEPTARGG